MPIIILRYNITAACECCSIQWILLCMPRGCAQEPTVASHSPALACWSTNVERMCSLASQSANINHDYYSPQLELGTHFSSWIQDFHNNALYQQCVDRDLAWLLDSYDQMKSFMTTKGSHVCNLDLVRRLWAKQSGQRVGRNQSGDSPIRFLLSAHIFDATWSPFPFFWRWGLSGVLVVAALSFEGPRP